MKLDKNVYNELLMDSSSAQRAGAIWVVSYLITILAAFTLIRNFAEFLKSNLSLIASGLPEESLIEIRNAISELDSAFASEASASALTTALGTGLASALFGISFIYLITKYLFRKEPSFFQILIIFGFSSLPNLLNAPILFINSIGFQSLILFFTSIYSIVCLGSGLKQVYYLRNIETILLVIGSSIASSIFLPGA
ncbi:MAG: YIP1 family protein [Candidatus Actinomarina sp.]